MKRTQEEIARWKREMQGLAKRIKGMDETEKWHFVRQHLIITAENHQLTLNNTCMLLMQCPEFTPVQVGGYRQWQKVGRVVRQGESSIGVIMVPIGIREKADGTEDKSDLRFRYVSVFDVSQTEEIDSKVA